VPAALQPVEDCVELRAYVTDALVDNLLSHLYGSYGWWWDVPWSDAGGGVGEPSDYSTTNNQEDGVDEMDIVKTDGSHLFVAREESVAILKSWPPAETRVVAELPIVGNRQGLFLRDDRLAVISSFWATPEQTDLTWGGTRLELFDINDPSNPQSVRTIELEGWLLGARMIEGHMFLVLRTWVPMPEGVWDLLWRDDLGLPANDPDLSGEQLQAVLELARSILTPLASCQGSSMISSRWASTRGICGLPVVRVSGAGGLNPRTQAPPSRSSRMTEQGSSARWGRWEASHRTNSSTPLDFSVIAVI
jgi:hypothetical protein